MTIRSGGRPRDDRAPHAHPYDPDAYATDILPPVVEPRRGGRNGRGGGGGVFGIIKFLVFALVLAGIVLVVALTALRPVVNNAILGWAADNPAALSMPFVSDIVRENLGDSLTTAVSDDPTQVEFVVQEGDTASTIGARLEQQGLIKDDRAFVFIAVDLDLTSSLQQGTFLLRKNMLPEDVARALLDPPAVPYVDIALRTGLRLEQITAKLQTLPLMMDVHEFYDLASNPPKALIDDYPWLEKILSDPAVPENATLEGFLWPASYKVLPDTTPDELIRLMLDKFYVNVGVDRINVPKERGLSFYQVLALASIVEREAVLDDERPKIAGVYQNRIDGLPGIKNKILNADPTVIWANDTLELEKLDFDMWQKYSFWSPPEVPMKEVVVPPELAGYQTYLNPGLIPGPIATPTLPSIDAALQPDTEDKYLYFVAIPEGGGAHSFAKDNAAFQKLLKEYGYI
jgi:peptidoglycan lytic transglycosylase G